MMHVTAEQGVGCTLQLAVPLLRPNVQMSLYAMILELVKVGALHLVIGSAGSIRPLYCHPVMVRDQGGQTLSSP